MSSIPEPSEHPFKSVMSKFAICAILLFIVCIGGKNYYFYGSVLGVGHLTNDRAEALSKELIMQYLEEDMTIKVTEVSSNNKTIITKIKVNYNGGDLKSYIWDSLDEITVSIDKDINLQRDNEYEVGYNPESPLGKILYKHTHDL